MLGRIRNPYCRESHWSESHIVLSSFCLSVCKPKIGKHGFNVVVGNPTVAEVDTGGLKAGGMMLLGAGVAMPVIFNSHANPEISHDIWPFSPNICFLTSLFQTQLGI